LVGEHDINFERSGDSTGGVSIVVHGEIDIATAPKLSEVLNHAIDDGARLVVVKLEHVSFMDSSGLRSLITAADRLNELEGQLIVDGASAAVGRVLEITGVIERLRTPPTEN
jgi:anti-anti-sigma factor